MIDDSGKQVHIALDPPTALLGSALEIPYDDTADMTPAERAARASEAQSAEPEPPAAEPTTPDAPAPRGEPPQPPSAPAPAGSDFPPPAFGEKWDDPHRIARLYLDARRTADGEATVIHWRDQFHRWNGAAWRVASDGDFDAEIVRHARQVFEHDHPYRMCEYQLRKTGGERPGPPPTLYPVTAHVKNNVSINLAAQANVPDTGADSPFWRSGGECMPPANDVIAAPNGLFTLDDIAAGRGPFSPPTPNFFTPNALPFAVEANPPEPATWLRCVREWCGGDEATANGLQEMMGYMLSASTEAQKIVMIVGPPRSGKGTVSRVLTALVGEGNVATTSFAALNQNFGLESLLGKRVAMIPDARQSGHADTATVVERLLSISGGDDQTVDRKNRPRITTKLRVRFVIASNKIPTLEDSSGAIATRFHILLFPHTWLGREDTGLEAKIRPEMPGVLRWAAEGYVRLRDRGYAFTPNAAAAEHRRALEDMSSPIKAFLRERCHIGSRYEVLTKALYEAWCDWNTALSRGCTDANVFGADLRAALSQVGTSQRRINGERKRLYVGVGLRPRADWGDPDEPPSQAVTRDSLAHVARAHGLDVCSDRRENVSCVPLSPVSACDTSPDEPSAAPVEVAEDQRSSRRYRNNPAQRDRKEDA